MKLVLYGWCLGLAGHRVRVGIIDTHPYGAALLPSNKPANVSFVVNFTSVPESTILPLFGDELQNGSHLMPLGLRGYGFGRVPWLAFETTMYSDCWFHVSGDGNHSSVLTDLADGIDVLDEYGAVVGHDWNRIDKMIDTVLNQTWMLNIEEDKCRFAVTDFHLFRFHNRN